MDQTRIASLLATYRDGLLHDTLPFWLRHAVDREHGGFLFCLDRDGRVVDTDKGLWQHGRFTWLLSTLDHELRGTPHWRSEWLDTARHGVEFLRRHGFDRDGRMFFQVTRDGRPLRKRRYVFSEAFAAIAFAAYARASGEQRAADEARAVFRTMVEYATTPGLIPPKVDPETRPSVGLAMPMITLVTAQVLRDTIGDAFAAAQVDRAIAELRGFVKPELDVVLEQMAPDGGVIDHFDGRTLNPGHALEAGWFVLDEAWRRGGDAELTALGTSIVDCMWRRGWDEQYGGLLYFVDLHGGPVQEYWHDMKFWWPHNEAILATLFAWRATRDERYAQWHGMVHDWAYRHFPDPEHGEWFGYLHRDGRRSVTLKGNLWKGPFHLPRMQYRCWQLLEGVLAGG
ncbi:MAG: AGE family epimerase/isomerase [Planctomycetota bacterium]